VELDGTRLKAAVSVGVSPTFEESSTANMEVHILDFNGDLVGKAITVEFIEFLRPMMKFDSTEELIATVMGNIQWVRDNL
jgi:riboflavin kinase/FMN adenylyltransferase